LFQKTLHGKILRGLRNGRTVKYLLGLIGVRQKNDRPLYADRDTISLYIDIPEEKIKVETNTN
jgi:hypothetical protein